MRMGFCTSRMSIRCCEISIANLKLTYVVQILGGEHLRRRILDRVKREPDRTKRDVRFRQGYDGRPVALEEHVSWFKPVCEFVMAVAQYIRAPEYEIKSTCHQQQHIRPQCFEC